MSQNLIKVFSAGSTIEADIIRDILEAENIYCFVQGYEHRSLLGIMGSYINPGIMVPADKKEVAQKIIQNYLETNNQFETNHFESTTNPSTNDKRQRPLNLAMGCFLALCFPGLGSLYSGRKEAGSWIITLAIVALISAFILSRMPLAWLVSVFIFMLLVLDIVLTVRTIKDSRLNFSSQEEPVER